MQINLKKLLMEYCDANPDNIQKQNISDCALSITQLRDRLYLLGNILYEDLDNQIYVASVRAGFADMNRAIIAMQLSGSELSLIGYAKEGFIKQNLCEKAFQKIQDTAHGKAAIDTSRFPKLLTVTIMALGFAAFIFIRGCVTSGVDSGAVDELLQSSSAGSGISEPTEVGEDSNFIAEVELTITATKAYNSAAKQFNSLVEKYNNAISLVCVDNIKDFPIKLEQLSLESESYEDNANIVMSNNSKEKIAADTEQIQNMTTEVEVLLQIVQQLNAPSGDWVCEKIRNIDGITGCQQVTESLNPDGLLGKEGGYSACVYFTHAEINQNDVPGNSIVAKGTDAGGAVEIYPTLADAQARVEYLASFDNTIFYSGSYAILGTMVVRTSYKFTDEQQFLITDAITMALTTTETDNSHE